VAKGKSLPPRSVEWHKIPYGAKVEDRDLYWAAKIGRCWHVATWSSLTAADAHKALAHWAKLGHRP
jgi:hypothetical protein